MTKNAHHKLHYHKPTQSRQFLLDKLKERGLAIEDESVALNALTFIGYFRLLVTFDLEDIVILFII